MTLRANAAVLKRRTLGRTGLSVTELGFGGAPLGGLYAQVEESAAREALEAAWEAGIRYFDTAPLYGSGLSEQRIGSFLQAKPADSFIVSTKVGRTLEPSAGGRDLSGSLGAFVGALPYAAVFDFSAEAVKRSIDASLTRLGLSRIDILYVHDPDDHLERAVRETFPVLRELREQGVVRAIGAGMNDADALAAFVRRCDVDVVLLAGRYTVLDRSGDAELLPLCAQRGVAVVAGGVYNSGITAERRPSPAATFDYIRATGDIAARALRMADECERSGVELPAAALQFPLRHPAVACSVVGMRTAAEVHANVARFGAALPPELWPALEAHALDRPAPRRQP